jgi:hypothetical protein
MTKLSAFVIMPFTKAESPSSRYPAMGAVELNTVYELIQEAFSESHTVKRADSTSNILHGIIIDLDRSDLVVADLTGLNPNVMYEVGIRHGFCKKTILITQDRKECPFDLGQFFTIEYKWQTNADRKAFIVALRTTLQSIESDPNYLHGPVHSHLGIKTIGLSEYERRKIVRQTHALTLELFWLISAIDIGIQIALTGKRPTSNVKKLSLESLPSLTESKKREVFSKLQLPTSLPCVELFLSENYIPEEFNKFGEVDQFRDVLRVIQNIKLVTHTVEDLTHVIVSKAIPYSLLLYKAIKDNLMETKIFVSSKEFAHHMRNDFKDFHGTPGLNKIQTRQPAKKSSTARRVKKS